MSTGGVILLAVALHLTVGLLLAGAILTAARALASDDRVGTPAWAGSALRDASALVLLCCLLWPVIMVLTVVRQIREKR